MRICFAVTEILGAHRNGGIGTATSHLAIYLASSLHQVTLLNCSDGELSEESAWKHLYRKYGIEVVNLPFHNLQIEPWMSRASVAAFDYLKVREFDVIVYQDWLALAYSSAVAKRCGLAFADTLLVVNTHGSKEWVNDVAGLNADGRSSVIQQYIERRAVELVDALVSPSQYMIHWMRSAGWQLPDNSVVIQNYLRGWRLAGMEFRQKPNKVQPAGHLIYFGRLEHRKGIYLFLDALGRPPLRDKNFRLTFLGREADANSDAIRSWLEKYRSDLLPQVQFLLDRTAEEARDFLVESAGIAVIPSLSDNSPCVIWEAIENGIPFVSTLNGGIPELIPDHEHARILVRPDAEELSQTLYAALEARSWRLPDHRMEPEVVGQTWLAWLQNSVGRRPGTGALAGSRRPLVALLHREGSENLTVVLQDLLLQTTSLFDLAILTAEDEIDHPRPMLARELAPRWLRWTGSLKEGLVAAWSGRDHQPLIVVDSECRLTPNAIENLMRGISAFPQCAITGQSALADPQAEPHETLASRPPRSAPPSGPLAVGVVENVFGDFPVALPPSGLSEEDTRWLPAQASAAWTMLAAWGVAGRDIVALPSVLSVRARPPQTFAASQTSAKIRDEVQSVYMAAIPKELRHIVAAVSP